MSSTVRNLILVVVGLVVGLWVVKLVVGTVIALFWTVLPIAVVAGVLYAAYRLFGPKALGGGRRTLP